MLFVLRVLQTRLRFFVVLGAIFLVLAGWEQMQRWRDWALDRWGGGAASEAGVSPDTEYFCPMCPGVLSNWPEQCPVCKMPLVRRRKGEAVLLPEGVVARMQLTPYRLQLAGVQTAPVAYEPLERRWTSWGQVAELADSAVVQIQCAVSQSDASFVTVGQSVTVRAADDPSGIEMAGTVVAIAPTSANPAEPIGVRVEAAQSDARLRPGGLAQVEWRIPLADTEPFRSQPRNPPPLLDGEPRELFVCDEHPRYLRLGVGACPFHDRELQARALHPNQRVEWFCPAHRDVTARQPGSCEPCGGLPLIPQVTMYSPAGQVLAVPESSVIDTGASQTVFIESGPGMFDAVPVRIGPRCGSVFPVLSGLEANQRVVVAGAFLLDAETRLDPSLAAGYFGAGPRNFSDTDEPNIASQRAADTQLDGLPISAADLPRIQWQQLCPVTKLPLGSMGAPVRVSMGEQLVYLCCDSCRSDVRGAAESREATAPLAAPGADRP